MSLEDDQKVTEYSDFKTVAKFQTRWMRGRIVLILLSLSLICFSVFELVQNGLNLSIDFRGGILIEVGFQDSPAAEDIRAFLSKNAIDSANVQAFGADEFLINLGGNAYEDTNQAVEHIKSLLSSHYPDNISYRRIETVGPKVGSELISTSILAVSLAISAMLIYIWMRFELPFALGSIFALAHDILITLGIFALFQIEFGLPIIAALLAIVGYSMNDTVVTYDRIRENLALYRRAKLDAIIDLSINETLTRTLVTSGTTLLALAALLIFGGPVIQPFIIAMTVGVLIGTYSSIFVAAPFLLTLGVKNNFSTLQSKKKKSKQKRSVL
ncbi:MAG: protein translocase subunit SecF [Pseudomonadota bacterium]